LELTVESVLGWEALDSRGTPTVACAIKLEGGAEGHAVVPSGASTGQYEAHERRDGGPRYGGKGVRSAAGSLNDEIRAVLLGLDASDQVQLDAVLRELDGTANLERLGANAILAASVASAVAAANGMGQPLWRVLCPEKPPLLPIPMVNIVSGGAHAGRSVDLQDILVVPVGATRFSEALEWAARVRAGTAAELAVHGHDVRLVADEGGLGPALTSNREAVAVVAAGIERSGLRIGDDVAIAIDVAANQLAEGNNYRLACENRMLTADEFVDEIRTWCDEFPIISVEDPLSDDDIAGWEVASARLDDVQLLGDDLFATSLERLRRGINARLANAVLVKPNQVGTVSDARRVIDVARAAGYATVVSARSGETEDAWLADLAVGWQAAQLKVGSTTRSERTAKWNRLLRLEAEHPDALFAGRAALAP
jgi:enolase 1/2/3